MILGSISALCMNGVASFQFHNVLYAHLTFAVLFFALALIHVFIVLSLDFKVSKESKFILRIRLGVAVFAAVVFIPSMNTFLLI